MSTPTTSLTSTAIGVVAKVDPCAPTLSIATLSAANLASLQATLQADALGAVANVEAFALNALNVPGLATLVNSLKAISTGLSLGGLSSSSGTSPFAAVVQAIIGKLITAAVSAVEQAVVSEVESIAASVIQQALSAVENFTAAELQKDLSPLIKAIATINGIVGEAEGAKALVSGVLSTSTGCPAKAAIMAEAYFKQGPR